MATPNIIHLITSVGGGGTENFLYQILAHSPKNYTHRVLYLGHDGVTGDKIRRLGIPVEKTNPWSLYQKLRQEKPDTLHTCLHWANQVGRIVGRVARVPFILSSHRSIDVWQKPWHRMIDRWTLLFCNTVIVNSDPALRIIGQRLSTSKNRPRLVKLENGLDLQVFVPLERQLLRRQYSLPLDAIVGGTLMRLHAEKGAEKIPAMADALLERHPTLILMIGGSGPLENSLKAATRQWGNRILWLGWQKNAVEFLSTLNFFWLLSREESFPQALLEASGMGLPWVAPDVGAVQELVRSGACGRFYPTNDLGKAIAAFEDLLAHLPQEESQAREAMPKIRARYDLSKMVSAFYTIVERRGQ